MVGTITIDATKSWTLYIETFRLMALLSQPSLHFSKPLRQGFWKFEMCTVKSEA
jgi:hypothetical protein